MASLTTYARPRPVCPFCKGELFVPAAYLAYDCQPCGLRYRPEDLIENGDLMRLYSELPVTLRPADLLVDLETGDRTNEHLFPKEQNTAPQMSNYFGQDPYGVSSFVRDVLDNQHHLDEMRRRQIIEVERIRREEEIRRNNFMARGMFFDEGNAIQQRRGFVDPSHISRREP